jgi:predicted PurR-regulated permease PerM
LTATLLLLLSLLIIAPPVLVMAPVLTDQLAQGMQSVQSYLAEVRAWPAWLTNVPFVGSRRGQLWNQMFRAGGDLGAVIAPYTATIRQVLLTAARGFR